MIDFACIDDECKAAVVFNLMDLREAKGCASCPQCHREYQFDATFLDKLQRLRKLIVTVQEAADILGDVNVAITTPAGEVRVPYWLMLTRLNTIVTMELGGRKVEFNFRVEPLNRETFR
jgi:hypothetical protein